MGASVGDIKTDDDGMLADSSIGAQRKSQEFKYMAHGGKKGQGTSDHDTANSDFRPNGVKVLGFQKHRIIESYKFSSCDSNSINIKNNPSKLLPAVAPESLKQVIIKQ